MIFKTFKNSNKLHYLFATLLLFFCSLAIVPTTSAADICSTPNIPPEVAQASGCGGGEDLSNSIVAILNAIIGFIGIVAVVVMVIGGINYMTSAGNTEKVIKARNTILYAGIGLIICALSFAIVNFVVSSILKQGSSDNSSNTSQTQNQNQDQD